MCKRSSIVKLVPLIFTKVNRERPAGKLQGVSFPCQTSASRAVDQYCVFGATHEAAWRNKARSGSALPPHSKQATREQLLILVCLSWIFPGTLKVRNFIIHSGCKASPHSLKHWPFDSCYTRGDWATVLHRAQIKARALLTVLLSLAG